MWQCALFFFLPLLLTFLACGCNTGDIIFPYSIGGIWYGTEWAWFYRIVSPQILLISIPIATFYEYRTSLYVNLAIYVFIVLVNYGIYTILSVLIFAAINLAVANALERGQKIFPTEDWIKLIPTALFILYHNWEIYFEGTMTVLCLLIALFLWDALSEDIVGYDLFPFKYIYILWFFMIYFITILKILTNWEIISPLIILIISLLLLSILVFLLALIANSDK